MAEPTSSPSTSSESPSAIPKSQPEAQPQQQQSQQPTFSLTSPNTALALLPPKALWPRIDRLRALYDKAYPKWPPHINLVYPFVHPELLDDAVDRVGAALASSPYSLGTEVSLNQTGVFPHKRDNTIFLC